MDFVVDGWGSDMRMSDVLDIMRDVGTKEGGFTCSFESCKKESSEVETRTCFGACLQFDFAEHLGHHALTLIVIDSHELVILLLADLVADDLTIDNGTHAIPYFLWLLSTILHVVGITFRMLRWHWLYPDVTDVNFKSVLAFAEPSFAFVVVPNTGAIDITCIGIEGWGFVLYLWLHLYLGHDLHLLFFPLDKGLLDFRLQGDTYALL